MQYAEKVSCKTTRQSSILILIGEGSSGNFQTFLIKCSKFKSVQRLMMKVECFSLVESNRLIAVGCASALPELHREQRRTWRLPRLPD